MVLTLRILPGCRADFDWSTRARSIIRLRRGYGGTGVMRRGGERDDIFLDDADRHDFIRTLAEARQKTGLAP